MREVKFRIWNKSLKKMSASSDIFELTDCSNEQSWGCKFHESHHVFNQSTSLKDVNGKEIYEGDIVRYKNKTYQVKFASGCLCLFGKEEWFPLCNIFDPILNIKKNDLVEIIGNIYENPNLLQGTK